MQILLFVVIISIQFICSKCELEYCKLSDTPSCLNKTHLMCAPKKNSNHQATTKETIQAVLVPLNKYRDDLRRFKFICNLQDFTWSNEFAEMAREMLYLIIQNLTTDYCTVTFNHKNILQFTHYFDHKIHLMDNEITKLLGDLVNSITPELSWMTSAYTNQIGCSKSNSKRLLCLINGVKLNYANQSYIYENDHDLTNCSYNNKTCYSKDLSCTDHFICNQHDVPVDAILLPIDLTSAKYVLHKFEQGQEKVVWNYDLQQIAERIVTKSLRENDKCLARLYPNILAFHLNGTQYFREQISNIDSVWKSKAVKGGIGCTTFSTKVNGTTYFNLYCLTENNLPLHFFDDFFYHIGFGRSDHWLIYTLLVLTYLCVTAAILLMYCLKVYELKRLLN